MGKIDLRKIMTDIENDGGATYDATTGDAVKLTRGYVVSLGYVGVECKNMQQITRGDVVKMFKRARRYGGFVGFWRDAETGRVYIDVSQVYDDEKDALLFARANEQLAIYDASRGVSVYLS